jgi:hypothetical protein
MRDGETRGRRGALTLEQMAANFRKLDANASERQLANESRVTRRRVQQVLDDNEMTWDAFKKWALQGPITLMIPVEGAQVRRAAYYWERNDDGELALRLAGEMKNIFIVSHLAGCAICGDYTRTRRQLA